MYFDSFDICFEREKGESEIRKNYFALSDLCPDFLKKHWLEVAEMLVKSGCLEKTFDPDFQKDIYLLTPKGIREIPIQTRIFLENN